MNAKEFREFIKDKPDKFVSLSDSSVLSQLNMTVAELGAIVSELFSDEEKQKVVMAFKKIELSTKMKIIASMEDDNLKFSTMKGDIFTPEQQVFSFTFRPIINSFQSDDIKKQFLNDMEFLEKWKFSRSEITSTITSMTDQGKIDVINDEQLHKKHKFGTYDIKNIIKSCSQETLQALLEDESKIHELFKGEDYEIADLISIIRDIKSKFEFLDRYKVDPKTVILSCPDDVKAETILSDKYKLSNWDITMLLGQFDDIDKLSDFLEQNGAFLKERDISVYQVLNSVYTDKKLEATQRLLDLDIDENEKLLILASADSEIASQLDRSNLSPRQIQVLDMPIKEYNHSSDMKDVGSIIVDYDSDLTQYEGLDKLIRIRPQDIGKENRAKAMRLAEICPNAVVADNLRLSNSTTKEFLEAEKWIDSVLKQINSKWKDVQKLAFIDHAIGKKVSYSPDFGTEAEEAGDQRALWKIIDSGYGVCNGIAQIEQYMLGMVGIKSELVSSKRHAYLKVKDIEIPRKDGTIVRGDTAMDPTWNLTSNRYDAFPNHFCRSYEEIRKFDILDDGTDRGSHKNDEAFKDGSIEIEDSVVRQIYRSIGLAKENGHFPIEDMMTESDKIAKEDISLGQKLGKQLELIKRMHPDFARCQNSSMSIIAGNLLSHEEMSFRKAVASRVYEKGDPKRSAIMYVWADLGDDKEAFYIANPKTNEFIQMDRETFVDRYECYDKDLEEAEGVRPWDSLKKEKEIELERSSGKIVSDPAEEDKGDER